jgi:hypothetical protein
MHLKYVTVEPTECGPEFRHPAAIDPIHIQTRQVRVAAECSGPLPPEKVVDELGLVLQDAVELVRVPDVERYTPTPQCRPLPFEFV